MKNEPKKLHLCCGKDIKKGYINVDQLDFGQGTVLDLNKAWNQLKSNFFDEILIKDGLEHLHSVEHFFSEAERVLKPGGKLFIHVPHFKSPSAYKMTHRHLFSWNYFKDFPEPHDPVRGFEVVSNRLVVENRFFPFTVLNHLANLFPQFWEKLFYVCAVEVVLQKKKALNRIDFLCPRNPFKDFTGIENSVLHVSKVLQKKGYSIRILSTDSHTHRWVESGIPVACFQTTAWGKQFYFSFGIFSELDKSDADIIHCNGFNNLVTFAGILKKKKHQRLILTLNSSGSSSFIRKLLWLPYLVAFFLLRHRISRFIAVSDFELRRFSKLFHLPRERFALIPNGVDLKFIHSIKTGKKSDQIISIGRLVKNKGFDHLLCAFDKVLKKRPGAVLKIVGDGEERVALEQLAKKRGIQKQVEFIGSMGREGRYRLFSLLKQSSVFVFLSSYESQGIVVSEALASGVPVLVSNNSGLADFVARKEAIGIDNPKNYQAVSEIILRILKNPPAFVPKKPFLLDWEKVGEETVKVYGNL